MASNLGGSGPSFGSGQSYICPEVVDSVVTTVRDGPQAGEAPRLSHREREVLGLVADGDALGAVQFNRLPVEPSSFVCISSSA
jgi:hypothetical protein